MNLSEFVRLYPMRSENIQWFLGAGASAAGGIPTAFDVIWEFKRTLYCAEQRLPLSACADLDDSLRTTIQRYFDGLGSYPAENSEDEYAHYFERTYPAEQDRRKYISHLVSAATPSYGHRALAALMAMGKARLVWTTNFDRLVEDASVVSMGSTTKLVVASLDAPQLALEAMNEGRWPVVGKLHGDFQSRRLKNTTVELRAQDEELRHALIEGCKRHGLSVVGYSGRDASVMDAFHAVLAEHHPFPSGLFWFHRAGSTCLPRVSELMDNATAKGVDAHLIECETFDELFGDILRLIPDLPSGVTEQLARFAQRASNDPPAAPGRAWPLLRTNALLIDAAPTVCRRLDCTIGNSREVLSAVEEAGAEVVAGRTQHGVLAFGRDEEVRRAFERFGIRDFGMHAIEVRRLQYESTELGLLYATLCRALARERPLLIDRRGRSYFARVDPARESVEELGRLRVACQRLSGIVPATAVRWSEGARVRLEFRWGRLWMLIEPTIWLDDTNDDADETVAREFRRERLAARYNRRWNAVLDGWIEVLVGPGKKSSTIRAFGIGDGIDASFTIMRRSGFSRSQ